LISFKKRVIFVPQSFTNALSLWSEVSDREKLYDKVDVFWPLGLPGSEW
jgi:hypothetical protein